jgi:hypothetical protein
MFYRFDPGMLALDGAWLLTCPGYEPFGFDEDCGPTVVLGEGGCWLLTCPGEVPFGCDEDCGPTVVLGEGGCWLLTCPEEDPFGFDEDCGPTVVLREGGCIEDGAPPIVGFFVVVEALVGALACKQPVIIKEKAIVEKAVTSFFIIF